MEVVEAVVEVVVAVERAGKALSKAQKKRAQKKRAALKKLDLKENKGAGQGQEERGEPSARS